jgi:hypothetical protein
MFFCFERWTKSEDDKLRKLKQEGNLKMKDIAKRFPGKSTKACQSHWEILNTHHVSFLQIFFFYWFWSAFYFNISVVF